MSAEADDPARTVDATANQDSIAERFVAEALSRIENLTDEIVEETCRQNAELAPRIRNQIEALRSAGMLAPGMRVPASAAPTTRAGTDGSSTYEPIGPYRPLEELGRGGQAIVYLAEDTRLHRPVALKVLQGFGPLSEILLRRFQREAEVTSRLDHPGICTVYDAGVEKGIPYIATRYIPGETLARRLATARQQANGEAAPARSRSGHVVISSGGGASQEIAALVLLIEKAARALHVAHEAGIVHRDVKPANIMVTPHGEPVILDFGLAADVSGEQQTLTQTGDLFGTPAYMSPEQLSAQRLRVDRRADVYSLGVTLFECLCLRRPFVAPTRQALYRAIQLRDPPDLCRLNAHVSRDLRVVLETALEKQPDRRYQTALDFAEDLRRVRELHPITARPVGTVGRLVRLARRRPAFAAVCVLLILGIPLVTGLVGYLAATWPAIAAGREQQRVAEIEQLLERGFVAIAEGAMPEAEACFHETLGLDGESPEAVAGVAQVLWSRKDAEGILALLDRHGEAVARTPDLERFRWEALNLLGRKAELAECERRLVPPTTAIGCFLAGSVKLGAARRGDPEALRQARSLLVRAVQRAPHARAVYHFALANVVGLIRDPELAEQCSNAITTLWPGSARAWNMAGFAHSRSNLVAAIAAYRKSMELDPGNASVLSNLGDTLREAGQGEEGIECLQKAIALAPLLVAARTNLAYALVAKKDFAAAVGVANGAIALDDKDAFCHRALGIGLRNLRRTEESIAALRRAIELEPWDGDAHGELADVLRDQGQIEQALGEYQKAAELIPDSPRHLSNLATALHFLGHPEAAETTYRRLLRIAPDHENAHYNLGVACWDQRNIDEAVASFRRATVVTPRLALAWWNLGGVLVCEGRFREGLEAMRKAVEIDEDNPVFDASKLARIERLLPLEERLPAILAGAAEPAAVYEFQACAMVAQMRGLLARSAALYERAFELDPELAEDVVGEYRRDAARVSARLGTGEESLAAETQARWRQSALTWLSDELTALTEMDEMGGATRAAARQAMRRLRTDAAFTGLRDPDGMARLPESERSAWAALWARLQ